MASLLVAAAVNIAVGLLINELFPPPDIDQEGPRLTELGFTSAAYGKFVNIIFGTDRVSGNIIDTPDPAIEEVVTVESQSAGGKGGGAQINATSYTYFFTGRIGWGIEGAEAIIRLWGDGKFIFDASSTSQLLKSGVTMTFYPGGPTQPQDPEEVSRRGSNISAYRHLTSTKLDRMPLADFGNRIPNFTAEIAYNSQISTPVFNMVEPAGLSFSSGATIDFNPDKNELYVNKFGNAPGFIANASDLTYKGDYPTSVLTTILCSLGRDGFGYSQTGAANQGPLAKTDIGTGEVVATFGGSGIGLPDTSTGFGNAGKWFQLNVTIPGIGVKSMVVHLNGFAGVNANGSVIDPALLPLPVTVTTPVIHTFSTTDGFRSQSFDTTIGIPDHDRGQMYLFMPNTSNDSYDLHKVVPNFAIGLNGAVFNDVTITLVKQFTRGTFVGGDDFEGTAAPEGWAINRTTGEMILSNGVSTILYNPDTNTILAQKANADFRGTHNYYTGNLIAYGISDAANGTIRVLDTRTLDIIRDVRTDDIPWPSGVDGAIVEESCCWDDRVQALYLSRGNTSDAATDFRLLKVFVNRVTGLGVGLDSVVSALSTTYQRQTMAGLSASDIDVTTLAGDTVLGYTLNRRSTMRSALEPLRQRFDFDGVQSDWIVKFPKRGATPTVTIPEEDVGELKRGRDLTDTPAVQEMRQDDLALPMSITVRYKNKDADYHVDAERDKRHLFPNPTMSSKTDRTLDIPIVEQPTAMKRLAQQKLLTAWNERVNYKNVIPWTYLTLDATDVFNMGVFGETVQLRMAEQDLGAGWPIEVVGVVEDTKQYSSTLAGQAGSGLVSSFINSALPTRLTPFDAPLLSLEDLLITPVSNAYIVVGAFEDGWPGASVSKSLDNVTYDTTGTTNIEAAIARVTTAPGAWNFVEGDFPNRWQEVADGGTMVIAPLRRADAWASAASEAVVLSGANTLGVVRAGDDQVEILQFQNAVLNDNNTVTLTRLLRGRLGTEDVADLGISVGDKIVLLSGATNVKEAGPILRNRLALSELNTPLFFKGVTIGTLIEDAPVVSATYTGRDIKPWSVAGVDAQFSGLDIIVNWARRTRGPLAGEWLDGTGVVPLGETIEQYEITLTDGTSSVTKTVNDVATVTFLEADFSGFLSPLSVTVQQVSGISSTIKSPAILTPVGDTGLGPPPSILGFETTVSLTGASVVVTKPTGTAEGDLMVAFMGVDEDEVTPPAGWTEIWSDLGTRARGYAWYKVAGASEPSNYTFTIDTSQGHVASIITVQGQGLLSLLSPTNLYYSVTRLVDGVVSPILLLEI
jgi:hypothetical protein